MHEFKVGDWVERVRDVRGNGEVLGPYYAGEPFAVQSVDVEGYIYDPLHKTHDPMNLKLTTPKTQRFTSHAAQISKLLDQIEQYKADATHGKKVWESMSITFALNTPEEAVKWWLLLNSAVNMSQAINKEARRLHIREGAMARGMHDALLKGSHIDTYEQWDSIDDALDHHFKEPKQ